MTVVLYLIGNMDKFQFWQRWLFVFRAAIILFGVLMAFLSGTPLFEWFNVNPSEAAGGVYQEIL
jgi:hypothetical protein